MTAIDRIALKSNRPTEFVDLTARLQTAVEKAGLLNGRAPPPVAPHDARPGRQRERAASAAPTSRRCSKRLVPLEAAYLHDDFSLRAAVPEDEPANGHAHARNLLLQPSLTILVEEGELVIGRWQSVFAVELDGPRSRGARAPARRRLRREREGDGVRRLIELELERQLHVDPRPVRRPDAPPRRGRRQALPALPGAAHLPPRAPTTTRSARRRWRPPSSSSTPRPWSTTTTSTRAPSAAAARPSPPPEGPARAIAVGDYYFAKATRLIAELGNPDVTSTIAEAMEAICRSQIDDLELRGRYPGDEAAYLQVVRGKTAALIAASCVAGAQLAGAPGEVVERVRRYGDAVGVAFQMTDDVVDFSEHSGKPMGQDIRERVLSLPLIYASEDASLGAEIQRLLAGPLAR